MTKLMTTIADASMYHSKAVGDSENPHNRARKKRHKNRTVWADVLLPQPYSQSAAPSNRLRF